MNPIGRVVSAFDPRPTWLVAVPLCLAFAPACAGKTVDSTRAAPDDGSSGGARSGVGGSSAGGATSSSGGSGAGGHVDAFWCVGDAGPPAEALRSCSVDSDCSLLVRPRCCGGTESYGIAAYVDCRPVPAPSCEAVDCAELPRHTAEDGRSTEDALAIEAHCRPADGGPGSCRSRVIDAPASDAGVLACEGTTCASDEVCVYPPRSVGGPAPPCVPVLDGGTCPEGTQWTPSCPGAGSGCVRIYVPPPAYCVSVPPSCGATPTCACLGADICGGAPDLCSGVSGRAVSCVNLAP